jgi:hypothetical protein
MIPYTNCSAFAFDPFFQCSHWLTTLLSTYLLVKLDRASEASETPHLSYQDISLQNVLLF